MRNVSIALFGIAVLLAPDLGAQALMFNRDIRPILSDACFQCHGPDETKRFSGLRLDDRAVAVEKGAIVPGDPAASKLVARIHADNEALQMPPVYSGKKITEKQKQLLERWIKEGADYQEHWSYSPLRRPEAPPGSAAIDFFLNQRLAQEGLKPVGEADRRTLARRLSLDLTGLPPDPALVEAFANDSAPDAYEKLVDQTLASPHFGERMAVWWLDLVRYADTVGFHNDVPYAVYPYRDYVIRAFNSNKPFDEFTREQLAGDLLPNATKWQKVASAYNRLNRLTTEGGAQPKEYLAKYAADRASTTSTVWLGSTMGCSECHDHKFDPFRTKEFYQLEAFFADIEEEGVFQRDGEYGPVLRLLDEPQAAEAERLDAEIAQLGAKPLERNPANLKKLRKYLLGAAEQWRALEPSGAFDDCSNPDIDGCDRQDLKIEPEGRVAVVLLGEDKPREAEYVVDIDLPAGKAVTALQYEAFAVGELEEFLLSEVRFDLYREGRRPERLKLGALTADSEEDGHGILEVIDDNDISGWTGKAGVDEPRRAMFELARPLRTQAGDRLRVRLLHNGRGNKLLPGAFRLSMTEAELPELPPEGALRQAVVDNDLNAPELAAAFDRYTGGKADWLERRRLERRKQALWDQAEECHIAHAVDEPREMRVLPRGDWMSESGDVVVPQTPRFLGELKLDGRRATRLDLANWLVSPENPLTSRVLANRLWELYFGIGISKTLDDAGSQGEPPVHPELLNWLASELVESGWNIKGLLRTMLLSDAYRRSSEPTPELREKDPFNRLYGRQSMIRLDAEFIRDSALEISGLLNPEMGGPSVKPYQPKGYYGELNFPKREYEPDNNQEQFRRGLYTHWQRTFLHPSLMAFDAPAREECTAERAVSNTPLQSLALLNDPSYIEAARAFAARILESGAKDQVDWAFRQAFARPAGAEEKQVVEELLAQQRQEFASGEGNAEELLAVGISPRGAKADAVELAAWTSVARALLNKHELVMRY